MVWPTVWTVGHSTRPVPELIAILATHGVELVADVRRFPGSRRRLIADVLTSLGVPVVHILNEHKAEAHRLVAPARLVDGRLTYEVDVANE
jgi:uncharacterized protein (DUF488 family)